MTGDTSVSLLPFVGPKYQQLLGHLGIQTVRDLLYHLPTRYLDLSTITEIALAPVDEVVVVQAQVWEVRKVRIRGGKVMITATVGDDTGTLQLTWFNQPFIEKTLRHGEFYRFAGEVTQQRSSVQMTNPQFELASKPMIHTGRLVPVYPQTAGLSSKWLRARIAPLLSKIPLLAPDFLPPELLDRQGLLSLDQALRKLHDPGSAEDYRLARRRLAFDELLCLHLSSLQRREQWQQQASAPKLIISEENLRQWIDCLPFSLTAAQHRVLEQITADVAQTTPMNRLLEGDVGSGKTVVAFVSALVAWQSGYQVAVMTPTAILASQHHTTFQRLVEMLGPNQTPPTLALRTSKSKMAPADITIGTHALLSEQVLLDRLGLAIIDEQHRFGVEQRATLMAKSAHGVHVLTMTATPIPRTLALTLYGDLSLSVLDEVPAGRTPVKTHLVPAAKRQDAYGFLRQAMDRGEQVYIVCPFVEDSDSVDSVRSATSEYQRLQQVFPDKRLALLHGRMKADEKDRVLASFAQGEVDALITTPVVEVGIDVPNASMMVIEGAERFGLAQLHQLRGRVGRGDTPSFCLLFSDATDPREVTRLKYVEQETSGLRLADLDLATRGPGELYGIRQSGLPSLRLADLMDTELVVATRLEAARLMEAGALKSSPLLREQLARSQPKVELN